MRQSTRQYKANLEELADGYQEARDEAFNDEFYDEFTDAGMLTTSLTEDDVQGFLDSFDFPDEDDWAMASAESEYEGYMDSKYEEMRDERLEYEQHK